MNVPQKLKENLLIYTTYEIIFLKAEDMLYYSTAYIGVFCCTYEHV